MNTKYFNDGVVGNNKIKASFTKTGEMIRLLYGGADYKQFLDFFHTGVKINDSALIYLHEDVNNLYSQEYVQNTNILKTEIFNTYFKTRIIQTDFVPIEEDVLIKKYTIRNENSIDLNINFLIYSKILTNLNNDTCGFVKNNSLIQYNHDFSVCTFSNQNFLSKQVNGAGNNISSGLIGGKDYIGMSSDSAVSYDLKTIKPGEEKELVVFVLVNKNKKKDILNDLDEEIDRLKKLNIEALEKNTEKYWKNYIEKHDISKINNKQINEKIKQIYNRTILLFPLLTNEKTGGISAGIEVDEKRTKCGRYSYCWPRDAVFITEALDVVGMSEEADKFYSKFCKITQSKNGMWEQRFFTDGRLAPCWGYQIDETASVIFGSYAHYKFTKDIEFLKSNLKMYENAITFLIKYVDDLLSEERKMPLSYDLWEEFEGVSLYSISAIYAAFKSMTRIYNKLKAEYSENSTKFKGILKKEKILEEYIGQIKEYCKNNFYDEEKKSYVRNNVDKKIDISLLGSIVPFQMFSKDDKEVLNTIEKINMTIRTYTGGYVRYENDSYMGGYNPWPIATLWMAWYYLEAGENDNALELFYFVTNSSSNHGFLGEQINNDTMQPSWVIGLTWSHAMYVLILDKLLSKGLI